MDFNRAQKNMQFAYFGGGPGVFVSGLVWLIAGVVAVVSGSTQASMLTLFFGGMMIHPLAILLSKLANRPGNHHSENPLARLAIETTLLLFLGLFIAFSVAKNQSQWFYPIMLLTIGGRYLMFSTIYALKIYWALAAVLIASGVGCVLLNAEFVTGAFIGGGLELIFALLIITQARQLDAKAGLS